MRGYLHSLCAIVRFFIIDQIRDRNPICVPLGELNVEGEM
jgi:hypothetical protein